jgi:pSer/pThr/pTyr-binding forkhead associated (FHA) protein
MDRPADRLALIEVLGRDGRPARSIDVTTWPLDIGRALSNHLVIDDPHVAASHVRLEPDTQGALQLQVLDTRNGLGLDGQRLAAGSRVALPGGGASLLIGQTRLRLRLPDEALPPEKPLPTVNHRAGWLALPLLALAVGEHALSLDPGAEATQWLPLLLLPLGLIAWGSVWALLSKVFQHQFDFPGHVCIAVVWLLLMQLADLLLPQLGAALAWPGLWRANAALQVLLTAGWIGTHLVQVLPQHRRAIAVVVASATVAGSAVSLTLSYRNHDSYSSAPYMATLPMPAMRLSGTVAPEVLIEEMAGLAAPLAERVRKAQEEDAQDSAERED